MNFPEIPYLYPARSIVIDGFRVAHIDVNADGGDPVLFLHDLGSDLNAFAGSYERLSPDRRVLGIDWVGFGKSDKPWLDDPIPFYTHLTVRFLDEFNIDRTSIVGHSIGGMVAARLASEHPERVDRLVLVAPWGVRESTDDERATTLDFWSYDRLEQMDDAARRGWFESMVAGWNDLLEGLLEQHVGTSTCLQYRPWARAVEKVAISAIGHPLGTRLERITAPTLLVWGLDDHIVPFDHAATAHDLIPGSRVAAIERCGHLPMYEQPEAFHQALEAFLGGARDLGELAAPTVYATQELEPWPGLSPEIGRFARMLFEQRARCLEETSALGYEQVGWRPSERLSSIGEKILSMGAITVRALYEVLRGEPIPVEVCSRFRLTPGDPRAPLEAPLWSAGRILGEVEWAHEELFTWLAERTDADLNVSYRSGADERGVTLRWVLWSLVEETIEARGYIGAIARSLPAASSGSLAGSSISG